jgi:hypothetical protein
MFAYRGRPLRNDQHVAREALDKLTQRITTPFGQTGLQRQQPAIEMPEPFMEGGWLDGRNLNLNTNPMRNAVRNPLIEAWGTRNSGRAYYRENTVPS